MLKESKLKMKDLDI